MTSTIRSAVIATAVLAAIPAFAQGARAEKQGVPFDEKGLIVRLHEDNQRQIMLGRLARDKAESQAAKDFGNMEVQEHEQLDKDLMDYAKKNNIKLGKVTAANDMERKHKAHVKATTEYLRSLEGAEFDAAYLAAMIADHDRALHLVSRGLQQFSTGNMQEMLRQVQPKLQDHRDAAHKALGELQISAPGVGGAGMEDQYQQDENVDLQNQQQQQQQ